MYRFVRANGRCPSTEFMRHFDRKTANKFNGSFDALTKMGPNYYNRERFKPLIGKGKPLWEFKEFDHRLYCYRRVNGTTVEVVLLDGWIKDKAGKSREEDNRIQAAQNLLAELMKEFPGGDVHE